MKATFNYTLLATALLVAPMVNNGYSQTESKNGFRVPAQGTIRVFMVFAEVDFSTGGCFTSNPHVGPFPNWTAGQLPIDADTYFDPNPTATPQGAITKFFYHASFGKYMVVGDYYPKVITIPCSLVTGSGVDEVLNALNAEPSVTVGGNATLVTKNNIPLNDFDLWTTWPNVPDGVAKTYNSGGNADGKIDYMQIVWRNHPLIDPNFCSTGFAPINNFGTYTALKNKTGFNNLASYEGCNSGVYNTSIVEYAHALFGESWWHDGTGGGGRWTFIAASQWFGLNSQMGAVMMPMVNAWDRNHLEWTNSPDKTFLISARNATSGNETETDLSVSKMNTSTDGTYILRDFITYGDAIRIKLPYLNNSPFTAVKNQYLWVENHQMINPFDKKQFPKAIFSCTDDLSPGIYAYIQVGKDQKTGTNMFDGSPTSLPNALGTWTYSLTAEGNYDFIYRFDLQGPPACIGYDGTQVPIQKTLNRQNPFTGYSDPFDLINSNGDNLINNSDIIQPGWAEVINNAVVHNLPSYGDSEDAFNISSGKTKLSIGTNPAPVPVYTHAFNQSIFPLLDYENRTIWLNGISIEIIQENVNPATYGQGAIKVKVRWDDYSEYALNLLSGKTIHLDQGLSPTRDRNPITFNGEKIFADPTTFTMLPNSYFHLEPTSTLIIDNGSTLIIQQNAQLQVHEYSQVIIKNGGKLIVEDGAILAVQHLGLLHIQSGGELILKNTTAGKGLCIGCFSTTPDDSGELRVEGTLTTTAGVDLKNNGNGFFSFYGSGALNLGSGRQPFKKNYRLYL